MQFACIYDSVYFILISKLLLGLPQTLNKVGFISIHQIKLEFIV